MNKLLRAIRAEQGRQTYRALSGFERLPGGGHLLRKLAHWPATAPILDWALGHYRAFNSFQEAESMARSLVAESHQHQDYSKLIMSAKDARPSDYAVMFHMRSLNLKNSKIFDLGGNAGNLFYMFDRYLNLPLDCTWMIYDFPVWVEAGKKLAAERKEYRLQFTTKWDNASGVDILIASGSLYCFETPFDQMINALEEKPKVILINRTPLISGPTKAAIQDGRLWMIACMLYNRAEFITSIEAIGYEVIDTWKSPEHFVKIIGKPESSAIPPTGIFFRLKQ
jgi:putative methyltransferase (TIGR04325 family)